ncbi:CoF synthetase [Marinobacter sp. S0848L]|uniref:CoF synthetase n=1 Tax=Marinobacter sp. S0848L TaxID=2926423 RepID=UPI001FF11082|nr:CoF synthetase [Marinobacter sp. S0848L]MCK0105468.1 CoF synthetase [Marinobacter sp. S0848L]
MIRTFRYYLTRMFFVIAGLRVAKWYRYTENFWNSSKEERKLTLENLLRTQSLLNSDSIPVLSLDEIYGSPILTKSRYREINTKFSNRGSFERKTSGTTGEPTKVPLSRDELSRMLGVRDYCFRHYGIRLGEREARFWGRAEEGIKNRLKNFALNRKVCFPVGESAVASISKVLSWKPDYLYGYGSLLLEAAALVEKHKIEFTPPELVICTAETITPAQKDYLARIFSAPVAEEYGATEFDILAFECRKGHRHFVSPWILVRAKNGQLLVTDIARNSSNLVNYDIGDSGEIGNSECAMLGGPDYISVLEGRSIHRFVYLNPDIRFHSVDLAYAINAYQHSRREIFSFKFVQSEYGAVDLYVSARPSAGTIDLQQYIESEIRARTGNNIVIYPHFAEKSNQKIEKSYFIQMLQHPTRDAATL